MINAYNSNPPLLLMVAGAKGTVASTVAVAVAMMRKHPEAVLSSLTTGNSFSYLGPPQAIYMTGWDSQPAELTGCVKKYGVLPENLWRPYQTDLEHTSIFEVPSAELDLNGQIEQLIKDISVFKKLPVHQKILNALKACLNYVRK